MMVPVVIRMSPNMIRATREMAKRENISVPELVRRSLIEYSRFRLGTAHGSDREA